MRSYGGTSFSKPEYALKRAEELVGVGQKTQGLATLHEVLKSRRHRTWQPALEKVTKRYIELCVELRKSREAKDGLIQYRMSCQAVNIGSLEDVIKHFLTLAQDKAVEAQSVVDAQKGDLGGDLQAIANLEDADTAESIMLAAVGAAEDDEVRKQREGATPWIKFLWETYRTVLDILKNNAKLEVLYQDVAKRGFAFCKQFNRAKEFNRICDTLRTHLANLHRNQDPGQTRRIAISNLTNAPTVELFLDTRFEQLAVAMDLDVWQEAYRSVEDIHGLMSLSKKAPKPAMLAAYFRALTRIFFCVGSLPVPRFRLAKVVHPDEEPEERCVW